MDSWETFNYDNQLAAEGETYQVMSFDKAKREMATQKETTFGGTKPHIVETTWTKQ